MLDVEEEYSLNHLASVASEVHGIDMAEKGLAVANIHKNKSS